jgi:histidinol phosphatase-like PHP family hydrolase
VEPADALDRIADALARIRNARPKVTAFRRAADTIRPMSHAELADLAARGRLTDLPGVGRSTAAVIEQALRGETPEYLTRVEGEAPTETAPPTDLAGPIRAALRGDLHLHSDWSDGGHTIEAMATAGVELGHEYLALTDHSRSLQIAKGLSAERLRDELGVVRALNTELAPFRILTGIEVDILPDGTLDQDEELLAELDVVVASVHSKLRMDRDPMTARMVRALESPHVDILGHCTGRMVVGRGRPESEFDPARVFGTAVAFDKAVEINARPERLDPPSRLLAELVDREAKVSIDSDAHATWQLAWQDYGCHRAAAAGIPVERIVNTWPVDALLDWTASHAENG